jgi:transcriptional regulator with XRE-family HTH domain
MSSSFVRTPEELKAARQLLGLSAEALATMVRMGDGRTVRRWEAGDSEIPGPVIVILETALDYIRQKEDLARQLEMLESGEVLAGGMQFGGGGWKYDTEETIERVKAAINSFDDALAILTRRHPGDGSQSNRVHWYNLLKINPINGEKDRWSLPGETSPEAALLYFTKDLKLGHGLQLCAIDDFAVEFLLEKCNVLNTPSGASQRLRAGEIEERFGVRTAISS